MLVLRVVLNGGEIRAEKSLVWQNSTSPTGTTASSRYRFPFDSWLHLISDDGKPPILNSEDAQLRPHFRPTQVDQIAAKPGVIQSSLLRPPHVSLCLVNSSRTVSARGLRLDGVAFALAQDRVRVCRCSPAPAVSFGMPALFLNSGLRCPNKHGSRNGVVFRLLSYYSGLIASSSFALSPLSLPVSGL